MTISPVPSQDKLVNLQNYEKLLSSLTKPGFRGFRSAREPEHFPRFRLMVSAGASLRSEGYKNKGTDDIHRELLKDFSIQVL